MLKSKTAQWTALTALLCTVLVAVTWFFLISPRRDEAAQLREQAAASEQQNDLLQLKVEQLKAQSADLPKKRQELATIYAQMPATASMPQLITNISTMATQSGVTLNSMAPGDAELIQSEAAAAAGAAVAGATANPSSGTATDTSGTSTGTTSTGTTDTGSTAGTTGMRVARIPMTITITGQYFQDVMFIKKLQSDMNRVLLITALDVQSVSDSKSTTKNPVKMVITGEVFSLPDAATSAKTATAGASASTGGTGATASAGSSVPANALPPTVSRAGVPATRTAEDS